MFAKILIANRAEIACRVARTARRMGIRTVGIYSDADANAMHVTATDEAHRVGPGPARDSYLRGDKIIALAMASGAQAIHPGYGFLSENADFAAAVANAGLAFIGPPPEAIRLMGSKSDAKMLMSRAGVPVVPGYHGSHQDEARLLREAEAIGYPVLIKASAGGGGKGMRVVERSEEFAAALSSARREAQSSFVDATMLIEKYLDSARHIEFQIFADTHGACVHLFERDCSVQRRHQKIIEEAPAPGMTAARRHQMGTAAVKAAQAIGYVGAGTVEFIVDSHGQFFFMEMNTRLQVEHPVTEMITGQDLVEWQLRVAAGEPLVMAQDQLALRGYAMEARVYAEDPERGFLPSIGRIAHLATPAESPRLRIDTGVRAGDEITQYYDPMIAKVIAWGEDRDGARQGLADALGRYQIVGVATNIALLKRIVVHEAFAAGDFDTGLIARHHDALLAGGARPDSVVLAVAAAAEVSRLTDAARARSDASADRYSPWHRIDTWWLNSRDHALDLTYLTNDATYAVRVWTEDRVLRISLPERVLTASVVANGDGIVLMADGDRIEATVVPFGDERHIFCRGETVRLRLANPMAHAGAEEHHGGHLAAPMSGTVVAVLVEPGDAVARGAALLIIEAMKMEHTITAPAAGVVAAVNYRPGDQVQEGADLVDIDETSAA